MSKNNKQTKRFCKQCGKQKSNTFCFHCLKETNAKIEVNFTENINVRDNARIRKFGQNKSKFLLETLIGWFPTKGKLSKKLPDGVDKYRKIDRENDDYLEVVRDYKTKTIIHKCHEPLTQHKKR